MSPSAGLRAVGFHMQPSSPNPGRLDPAYSLPFSVNPEGNLAKSCSTLQFSHWIPEDSPGFSKIPPFCTELNSISGFQDYCMSTQTQTVTRASTFLQPKSDPRFLTAQDQRADRQHRAQSRGLVDSQGQPLRPLPPPTRPRRQIAGSTDTSGLPGLPPDDNP
ncbi:hypothetical protein M422DRAFT_238737 [Sphaerobolus stellatus SS14]|nr:hypothetical protein M422DRAFT_238737 [Sphaerobolus stellatus SS14]